MQIHGTLAIGVTDPSKPPSISMAFSGTLLQYIQHQARLYHRHKKDPSRTHQLKCLEASTSIILYNPLALKPYSWALSTLLYALEEEEALSILDKLIRKYPENKGFTKLLKLYKSIKNNEKKYYKLQFVEVPVDQSLFYLESDFLYSWGCLQMLSGRHHEPSTIQLMQNILERLGGSVVHAGSWYGDMLPALSKACKKENRVYAFEPVLNSYILSKQTIVSNKIENVHLFNMGLGSSFRSARITTSDSKGVKLGGRSFVDDQMPEHKKGFGDKELISIIPLDSISIPGKVSLLHLDIEGSELSALEGACNFIASKQPIILIEDAHAQGTISSKIKQFMDSFSYVPIRPIPSLSVWSPSDAKVSNSIYEGVSEGASFKKSYGMMIQEDWLDDCIE